MLGRARRLKCGRCLCAVLVAAGAAIAGWAWDGSPAADRAVQSELQEKQDKIKEELSGPFCYFLMPSDEIGFKDCPEGTQVTYDGAFNTGFGEFWLWVPSGNGVVLQPVNARVKTLLRGYLPVVEYDFQHMGVSYHVQAFAAPIDLNPRNNLINFVRVIARNDGDRQATDTLVPMFTERRGIGRENLGCPDWYRDKYMPADDFSPSGPFTVEGGRVWRSSHLVFVQLPKGPGGMVERQGFTIELEPGEQQTFEFKVPYVPVHKSHTDQIEVIVNADYDDYLEKVIRFWENELSRGAQFEVPEPKVVNTMKSSLIYDLIARDISEDGKTYVQKVSDVHYDAFWVRDGAYIVRAYDLLGMHKVAEECIGHFLLYNEDGSVKSFRGHQPDSWGQSLWTVGAHYRITGDMEFAKRVYPAVPPHIEQFEALCAGDPLNLWPVSGPYDNEGINAHYTGHSFWAMLGLKEAITLAKAVGKLDDAAAWQELHDEYLERFMVQLRKMTDQTEGYIPPGIDDPSAGNDWANASGGVYPFEVLDPHDPLVGTTLRTIREYKYREGIMTYGPNAWTVKERTRQDMPGNPGLLHHYETFYLTQALLARGEQRKVLEDFYSILVHTGSTNSGFEWSIDPWADRDPKGNFPPHGWFAARYNELLRNMLVREEGRDLHLASVLSPEWLKPGDRVKVQNAPTSFGVVSYTVDSKQDGADVEIRAEWREAPEDLLFHIPWFLRVTSARADGRTVQVDNGVISLRPSTRSLALKWEWKERPDLSYKTGVRLFLNKYWIRDAREEYGFLFPRLTPPKVFGGNAIFVGTADFELFVPGGVGEIRYTTDGSAPRRNSRKYSRPIRLTETTIIRAVTVWADGSLSEPMKVTLRKQTPREADNPRNLTPTVDYAYYEGAWDRLPDFNALTPQRTGFASAFDIERFFDREDDFAVKFSGYIDVPADGIYTFYTLSDDGSRLFIGSTLVVDNDGLHAALEARGQIALKKGKHAITVTFFERGGAERLAVSYAGPGIEKRVIPASSLFRAGRGSG
ncbi:MAG: chitobiase/beta-hexosaminidase C-terminal domain-containing protein [Armatimonadetes bacterium]|nr:chitobiase/beta-hexosaminidase C-terminal domain-containing protein [Armatimonadota bacterium]